MSSIDIHRMREEFPERSDEDAARALAEKYGYTAMVRYKNSKAAPDFTNIGVCWTTDELRAYLTSSACHDVEVIYKGKPTKLPDHVLEAIVGSYRRDWKERSRRYRGEETHKEAFRQESASPFKNGIAPKKLATVGDFLKFVGKLVCVGTIDGTCLEGRVEDISDSGMYSNSIHLTGAALDWGCHQLLILLPSELEPPTRHGGIPWSGRWRMLDEPRGVQRWTAKRRASLVRSILRGDTSMQEAARLHGLTIAEPEEWRDKFLLAGENALRSRPRDEEGLKDEQIKKLKQKVGKLVMDLDILKEATKLRPFGERTPDE